MILGGGGLLGNAFLGDVVQSLLVSPDRKKLQDIQHWSTSNAMMTGPARRFNDRLQALVAETLECLPDDRTAKYIWGVGHNGEEDSGGRIKYTPWLSEFRMVGLRDWHGEDSRHRWVPCASCLHPAFDRTYPVTNDVIWFEHKKGLLRDFGNESIPRFVNSGNNMQQTIELLASANIILTNSYHGAYWGTLLGRRVVVVDAWSTKFRFMRFAPVFMNSKKHSYHDVIDQAEIHSNALEISRQANRDFWQELQENAATTARARKKKARESANEVGTVQRLLDLGDDICE